jgi:eukaryotic-like serine/threonine-protein kinase
VRDAIADYEVIRPWDWDERRYVCRAPRRLGRDGDVMVAELAVDAEGWQHLCDWLVRLASAPAGASLELIEVGPDLETGRVFLATEAALDGTLARPEHPLGPDRRVAAVEAVARGAHALHEVGLAHGSIHPGAVVLTSRGPRLDVPRLDAPAGEAIRIDGWIELECVDPDLLRGEPPSRASDIWALGATLHHALSKRPLFAGIPDDEPVTAVQRVMMSRPESDPEIRPGLRDLIAACLAADPADRPPTAAALAGQLIRAEV